MLGEYRNRVRVSGVPFRASTMLRNKGFMGVHGQVMGYANSTWMKFILAPWLNVDFLTASLHVLHVPTHS